MAIILEMLDFHWLGYLYTLAYGWLLALLYGLYYIKYVENIKCGIIALLRKHYPLVFNSFQ
jgi:hypothetical protein